MHTDWQTIVTLGIGAAALGHVARRWWPGFVGLFKASPAKALNMSPNMLPNTAADPGACGQANAPLASGTCGSGCGNCGQTSTPTRDHRDHRVHIVRRTAD